MSLKAAELFSGYGGLALAVEEVFGAETTWFSEFDAAPSKILAHHWPNVPNYGDVTQIDFNTVPHVDIISGGSPCQDLSAAGRRKGMTDGTRSNLWVQMREAIATIKPTYVVWENVRGAYSAEAYSELEHCPGCMGNPADRGTVLRALGRVLGDLSDLGYDCQWRGLRAADVGAPHGRFRVFVLATLRDHARRSEQRRTLTIPSEHAPAEHSGVDAADTNHVGHERAGEAWNGRAGFADGSQPASDPRGSAVRELPGGAPAEEARAAGRDGSSDLGGERSASDGRKAVADASSAERRGPESEDLGARQEPTTEPRERTSSDVAWGEYEPAIRRWESTLGRRAPAPTEPTGRDGGHRLSARFAEWMMGVPDGWIVGVPGISRNEALKAAGNGVVPQQAAAALRDMLTHTHERTPHD